MGHDPAVMFRWKNQLGYGIDPVALSKDSGILLRNFAEWLKTVSWSTG